MMQSGAFSAGKGQSTASSPFLPGTAIEGPNPKQCSLAESGLQVLSASYQEIFKAPFSLCVSYRSQTLWSKCSPQSWAHLFWFWPLVNLCSASLVVSSLFPSIRCFYIASSLSTFLQLENCLRCPNCFTYCKNFKFYDYCLLSHSVYCCGFIL